MPARRDAIANWKFLGPGDTSNLIWMVPVTVAMRCHLIPLAPCNLGERLRKLGKTSCPIVRHLA